MSQSAKQQGTVRWFNNSKGYGFIGRVDGGEVFVHHTQILMDGYRTLETGQAVAFDLVPGSKGHEAKNVEVVA